MKRHFQTVGVRNWAGDDLVELQSEPLAALDAFFSEYDPCVLQGCEITESADNAGTFDVAPGLVVLEADNQSDGTHRAMVMPFLGAAGVALPLYLIPTVETLTDVYADGKSKPIAYVYTAQASGVDPGDAVPHLTLTADGGNRFVDAVQDAGHRFISDDERAKWNRILDQAKAYADSVAAVGSEAALRNAKEYTDARETAILAAADAKDESTLRTAKEYADRIVAALAGSAPDLLNTLEELAAALNNDPDFAAKVMQQISERVTKEAMEEALEEKAEAPRGYTRADLNELYQTGLYTVDGFGGAVPNGPANSGNCRVIVISGHENRTTQIAQMYESDRMFFRRKNEGLWSPWVELWHSGNFNPNSKQDGTLNLPAGTDLNTVQTTGTFDVFNPKNSPIAGWVYLSVIKHTGGANWVSQTLYSFGESNVMNGIYHRCGTLNDKWSNWVELCHSGNIKPTYYAQINPNGNAVGQVGDWIQSVEITEYGGGIGYYYDITPKVPVNTITIHVSKLYSGGNTFRGSAPVAGKLSTGNKIRVFIPDENGYGRKWGFNISVNGA